MQLMSQAIALVIGIIDQIALVKLLSWCINIQITLSLIIISNNFYDLLQWIYHLELIKAERGKSRSTNKKEYVENGGGEEPDVLARNIKHSGPHRQKMYTKTMAEEESKNQIIDDVKHSDETDLDNYYDSHEIPEDHDSYEESESVYESKQNLVNDKNIEYLNFWSICYKIINCVSIFLTYYKSRRIKHWWKRKQHKSI